jgi:hypothetical protein
LNFPKTAHLSVGGFFNHNFSLALASNQSASERRFKNILTSADATSSTTSQARRSALLATVLAR